MSQNLQSLLALAAEMRTVGHSWDAVAEKVHRRPNTCKQWASRYRSQWETLYHQCATRRFHETSEEMHTLLRNLMRDDDKKVRQQAISLWIKSGAQAYGMTGSMKLPITLAVANSEIDEEVNGMRTFMTDFRQSMDADRRSRGLPPATDAEYDEEFDRFLENVDASCEPAATTPSMPAVPASSNGPILAGLVVLAVLIGGRPAEKTGTAALRPSSIDNRDMAIGYPASGAVGQSKRRPLTADSPAALPPWIKSASDAMASPVAGTHFPVDVLSKSVVRPRRVFQQMKPNCRQVNCRRAACVFFSMKRLATEPWMRLRGFDVERRPPKQPLPQSQSRARSR